jgi:hypothetical protein
MGEVIEAYFKVTYPEIRLERVRKSLKKIVEMSVGLNESRAIHLPNHSNTGLPDR